MWKFLSKGTLILRYSKAVLQMSDAVKFSALPKWISLILATAKLKLPDIKLTNIISV